MITSLLDDRFMMINIDDKLNFILFIDDRFMINDQCLIHNGGQQLLIKLIDDKEIWIALIGNGTMNKIKQ